MIRNLKVLGLALAAVFALSAVVASAASAQQGKLTINGGNEVTLDATEIGQNAFTAFGNKVECPGTVITGHKINETPHKLIPANATEVTLTPHFGNACFAEDGLGKHKVTVTMTTCDFHAQINQTTGGVANTYGVTFGITCINPHDVIHIDVYAFANSELGGIQCSITITPTTVNLKGAHLTTDTPQDELTINGTVGPLHAERSGSGCSTETDADATQHVNVTVKGTTAGGGATGITVTD